MTGTEFKRQLPGYIATALVILATSLWTLWGMGEMYHEGWWGPWTVRLRYLVFGVACLVLTLVALTWPRLGGWLTILVGGAFTVWWWGPAALRGQLTLRRVLSQFPLSGMLVIIGMLFLCEGRTIWRWVCTLPRPAPASLPVVSKVEPAPAPPTTLSSSKQSPSPARSTNLT